MRPAFVMLLLALLAAAGCKHYVPVNLPLEAEQTAAGEPPTYRDDLGREIGGADADGPEYRITMLDGTQFVMKSPRIVGDSVVGYYRPTEDEPWAAASIYLFDMRVAEKETVDWLSTMSLLVAPITLALLLTL